MVVILALLGALLVGALTGLAFCGFVVIGDRRKLDILAEQLSTEHRMSALTHRALAEMRQAASEHFRRSPME